VARKLVAAVLDEEATNAVALHLYALILAEDGSHYSAAESLHRAIEIEPAQLRWRRDMGVLRYALGEYEHAAREFEAAVSGSVADIETVCLWGWALLQSGELSKAKAAFSKASTIDPGGLKALRGLIKVAILEKRFEDASELCSSAAKEDPQNPDVLRLFGELYVALPDTEAALEVWSKILQQVPNDREAHVELVSICWTLGNLNGTLAHTNALIDAGAATEALRSFHCHLQLYHVCEAEPNVIRGTCEEFGRSISPGFINTKYRSNSAGESKRLRIGYLSGEFIHSAAFFFLSSLIGNHDRNSFDIFLYHTRPCIDRETMWYQQHGEWRDCRGLDCGSIISTIRQDDIDILVDLSGFYPHNGLAVFAARAAPIQVAYPNCPMTTGISNIDYIFTDRWTCPEGHEEQYSEHPVFLPFGYLAYSPEASFPIIVPPPVVQTGIITFGLFQRLPKVNCQVLDAISRIMYQSPGARLLIQNAVPTLDNPESMVRKEVLQEFEHRGIGSERVHIIGLRPHCQVLELISQTDIALDTFPYQGQTTTCECLWMGVPVVALSGKNHAARVGTALLERAELHELVADTVDQYVDTAASLANDVGRLSYLRAGMRERLRNAGILDGRRLARDVEASYIQMRKYKY
jgi:predicted O-linked N-acetylglucosamine transferase (SPINDLY family)